MSEKAKIKVAFVHESNEWPPQVVELSRAPNLRQEVRINGVRYMVTYIAGDVRMDPHGYVIKVVVSIL